MFFDNHRDATMRLEGTIIQYGGKAAIVEGVREDLKLVLLRFSDGKHYEVDQRDPLVRLVAPPLGYVNTPRKAMYAMRKPARMWKQGLPVRAIAYKGRGLPGGPGMDLLARCLDNNYPTLEQALGMFKSTNPFKPDIPDSVAFHRSWAVSRDGGLLYKETRVGEIGDAPMLDDKYVWLAECLKETIDGAH